MVQIDQPVGNGELVPVLPPERLGGDVPATYLIPIMLILSHPKPFYLPFKTRDTVAVDTPAARATSMTETALDLRRGALFFNSVFNVHLFLVVGS